MNDPPPDGGATYMGRYSITNPWTAWLISRAPEIVAMTPRELEASIPVAPLCPGVDDVECRGDNGQRRRMIFRPGAWACYHHDPTVRVLVRPVMPKAPRIDVLRHVGDGKILDYEYRQDPRTGRSAWRVAVKDEL